MTKLVKTYTLLLSLALLLLVLGTAIPENGYLLKTTHLLLVHVGIGIAVACFVAITFDRLYHTEIIGRPLTDIKKKFLSTKKDLDVFRVKLDELSNTIVMHNNILKFSNEEGITKIYRRKTDEFQVAVKEAVKNAEKFIYTLGRTHRTMLIEDEAFDGWLLSPLLKKINQPSDLVFKILLANTFDDDTGFKRQVAHLPESGRAMYMPSRYTAIGLIKKIEEECLRKISISLLNEAPPYAILITEKKLFIEYYLPSQRGGRNLIFEIEKKTESSENFEDESKRCLYDILLEDYIFLNKQHSSPFAVVISSYIEKKNNQPFQSNELEELKRTLEKAKKLAN